MRTLTLLFAVSALALAAPAEAKKPAPQKKDSASKKDKCGFCYGTELKSKPTLDSDLSEERKAILTSAESYIHKVSDCGGEGREKLGADVLEQIYKDGLQDGWKDMMSKQIRPANHSKWSGPWSWCAIYAVAAVRKAGITDLHWGTGKLVGRKAIGGHKGAKPGDIAFWTGGLNHHDIIEKIDGKTVYTIDGNQECSGIMRKKRDLSKMAGYYKIVND